MPPKTRRQEDADDEGNDARANRIADGAAAVAAVSLRLPPFWHKNPQFWFVQTEAEFEVAKITRQLTQFRYVVRALDHATAEQVMEKIQAPRLGHEYDDLKAALLATYGLGRRERASRLANMGGLGDRKPSHLLAEMKTLLGTEPSNFLFEHLWLQNLPVDIRLALAQREGTLEELAKIADGMWQEKSSQLASEAAAIVAAARKRETKSKPKDSAPTPTPGHCYYHARFGAKANKCRSPCTYASAVSENAAAGQ